MAEWCPDDLLGELRAVSGGARRCARLGRVARSTLKVRDCAASLREPNVSSSLACTEATHAQLPSPTPFVTPTPGGAPFLGGRGHCRAQLRCDRTAPREGLRACFSARFGRADGQARRNRSLMVLDCVLAPSPHLEAGAPFPARSGARRPRLLSCGCGGLKVRPSVRNGGTLCPAAGPAGNWGLVLLSKIGKFSLFSLESGEPRIHTSGPPARAGGLQLLDDLRVFPRVVSLLLRVGAHAAAASS